MTEEYWIPDQVGNDNGIVSPSLNNLNTLNNLKVTIGAPWGYEESNMVSRCKPIT
jgi:hypothetical protein